MDISKTINGKVYLNLQSEDSSITFYSSDLIVYLDEEEANAKYFLDPSTLESSSTVSSWKLPNQTISIHSNYNLGYIPNTYHEPKAFEADVTLTHGNHEVETRAEANLRYLYNKWYSGLLKSRFELDAKYLGLDHLLKSESTVEIIISHPILPPEA